jgi:NitT/TauT family transport system substrate-binding protein
MFCPSPRIMSEPIMPATSRFPLSRRGFFAGTFAASAALGLGGEASGEASRPAASPVRPLDIRRKVRVAWIPQSVCVAAAPIAKEKGFFDKYNIDAEVVEFRTHNHDMIWSVANDQADVAVAMMANWLEPIQDGLPARVFAATHGGCVRLLGSRKAGMTRLEDVRGKRIVIPAIPGPAEGLFFILLSANGINPNTEVEWVRTPLADLGAAISDGRGDAIAQIDPQLLGIERTNSDLVPLADNSSGPFRGRSCCIAVGGEHFLNAYPEAALATAQALSEAADWIMANPEETAAFYAGKTGYSQNDIIAAYRLMNFHGHHLLPNLRDDVAFYARQLQSVGRLKPDLDISAFAERAYWGPTTATASVPASVHGGHSSC